MSARASLGATRSTEQQGRTEPMGEPENHPIGSDADGDVGPTYRGERTFPPGLQTQQLKCHSGQSDSHRLVRKKKSRPVSPGLRYLERPGPGRRSCSSSLTRPTSPPPVQNRRARHRQRFVLQAAAHGNLMTSLSQTQAESQKERASESTAACVVPPRLGPRPTEKRSQRADLGSGGAASRYPGEGGGSWGRAKTSASAADTSDPREF